jgi:hypothetical protein
MQPTHQRVDLIRVVSGESLTICVRIRTGATLANPPQYFAGEPPVERVIIARQYVAREQVTWTRCIHPNRMPRAVRHDDDCLRERADVGLPEVCERAVP